MTNASMTNGSGAGMPSEKQTILFAGLVASNVGLMGWVEIGSQPVFV